MKQYTLFWLLAGNTQGRRDFEAKDDIDSALKGSTLIDTLRQAGFAVAKWQVLHRAQGYYPVWWNRHWGS